MARYFPEPVPYTDDMPYIREFLGREFSRLHAAFEEVEQIQLDELHAEPERPRGGMIRWADGTNWNPGDGAGFYAYDGTNWLKLNNTSDLAAIEALTGTGLLARTGANTWATRTIVGTTDKVTVTNGDGVAGNPTLTIPNAVTLVDPTVSGLLRLTNVTDISSLTSTGHAFQIGVDSGLHLAIDSNEIQARNNGVASGLILNDLGGNIIMHGNAAGLLEVRGGTIRFPVTQIASGGANDLDDYEEGTWTPILTFGGASTGITYSVQVGTYVKIGKVVVFQLRLILTSKGTATGSMDIQGLPFNVSSTSHHFQPVAVGFAANFTGLTGALHAYAENNTDDIVLRQSSATGMAGILTDAFFTDTTDMIIGGSYQTST